MAGRRLHARKRNNNPIMARPKNTMTRQRSRRIFRTRRRFGWGWIRRLPLLWLGASAICGVLIYFLVGSGIFSVRTVEAANLRPADVASIEVQCRCIGANIFVVRADEIRQRLVRTLPTLVVTRVYTRLPNQLVVEAYRKTKVAIWRTPEAAYGVDETGEVLQVWKHPFPKRGVWAGLPVFDDKTKRGRRLLVGQSIPAAPLTMALNLRDRLPTALRGQARGYVYQQYVGVTLQSRTGWWALFGMDYSDKLDVRMAVLQAALDQVPAGVRAHGCLDLRLDRPVARTDRACGA